MSDQKSTKTKRKGSSIALFAIIAAIWVGVFGFIGASASRLTSDQLFVLIQEGLLAGVVLTVIALLLARGYDRVKALLRI